MLPPSGFEWTIRLCCCLTKGFLDNSKCSFAFLYDRGKKEFHFKKRCFLEFFGSISVTFCSYFLANYANYAFSRNSLFYFLQFIQLYVIHVFVKLNITVGNITGFGAAPWRTLERLYPWQQNRKWPGGLLPFHHGGGHQQAHRCVCAPMCVYVRVLCCCY